MPFSRPVSAYMTSELDMVGTAATLDEVALLLERRRISAVPLVGPDGAITGVVSRSDLLRAGRIQAGRGRGVAALVLPDRPAASLVTRAPVVCEEDTPLREAARVMVAEAVHRVFVVRGRRPIGVLSTFDLTTAVRDLRIAVPLAEIMSAPVTTIDVGAPISAAAALLVDTGVTSIVAVDWDWPIGMLGQSEVLASRDLPPETRVDDVMDPAVVCLPARTAVHHAAALATGLGVRRVLASSEREMVGIVGGLDFARLVARLA